MDHLETAVQIAKRLSAQRDINAKLSEELASALERAKIDLTRCRELLASTEAQVASLIRERDAAREANSEWRARAEKAETLVSEYRRSFDGHVYVRNEEYGVLCESRRERDALRAELDAANRTLDNDGEKEGGAMRHSPKCEMCGNTRRWVNGILCPDGCPSCTK
jgi:hypothetical protein